MKVLAGAIGSWLIAISLLLVALPADASVEIEALLQQADAVRSSDAARFQQLLTQVESVKGQATPKQLELLQYLHAYSSAYAGQWNTAARQARQLAQASGDVNMQYRAGALMVNSYAAARRFTEGLRQLERTLLLVDQIHDPVLRQHGLIVAAQLYSQIGQHELALRYAERILLDTPPPRVRCFAAQYRLEALQNLDRLPLEDTPMVEAIEQCAAQREPIVANLLRGMLAHRWAEQGRHVEAIALIRAHLAEAKETRFPRLIGSMHSLLGELALAVGDLEGADWHAKAAIAQRAGFANSLPLTIAYKTRYEVALRRNDAAAALEHYRRFAETDKNYLNDVKARELAYQIVRHETLQKSQQIELLSKQNQVLQLQQAVERQSIRNSGLLIMLLAFLAAAIGYWAYGVKRMHLSLRRSAQTDALTGISNRHHFTVQSEQTLVQCASAGEPASLIMFDLDHFKIINDDFGHGAGDWVLTQVAAAIVPFCRRIDHLGRIGGEEFAILLHGCDLHAATRLAEDCRMRLSRIDTRDSGHTFAVSASFGVSSTLLSGYSLAKLLSHADLMLYRAKREGRDRVRAHVGDMPLESQTPLPLKVS